MFTLVLLNTYDVTAAILDWCFYSRTRMILNNTRYSLSICVAQTCKTHKNTILLICLCEAKYNHTLLYICAKHHTCIYY